LSQTTEEIAEMLDDFDKDSKALRKSILKLCWYMRGGLTLEEAMTIGFQDRELISEIISENLKVTEETKMPFF
jgi:hypothetical protein